LSVKTRGRFAGQVILITGACSGIGLAAAKAFAREGASLMLAARRVDKLNEAAAGCSALGIRCEVMGADLQHHQEAVALAEKTIQAFGRIDVLINNAGVGFYTPFDQQGWDAVTSTLRTNLEGAIGLTQAVLPQMYKQGSGMILNVSSVVGKRAAPKLAAYCASKYALWGFSEALRLESLPKGVQVCHFCPTSTATEFHARAGIVDEKKSMHSPDQVAAAMVEAVYKRKREYIMSLVERVLIKVYLMAPAFTDKLLSLARGSQR
jgi:short-subunit dehydrogenase